MLPRNRHLEQAPAWRSRVFRFLGGLSLLLACWLTSTAGLILWEPSHGRAPGQADAIVVLGAAAYGSEPSPVFRERLRHAHKLFRDGVAPVLLFTGGSQSPQDMAEAEVARQWALEKGVPDEAILVEARSRSTVENLTFAQLMLQDRGMRRAVLVSDPLHLARARLVAERLGLEVETSPTPTSRFRSLETQLPFLMRECYFYTTTLVGLAR